MNRFVSFFQSMSLRGKLIATLLLCIILPGAAAILASGYAAKDVIKEHTIQSMEQKLELTGNHLSEYLKMMVEVTTLIQFDVELNTILKKQGKDTQAWGQEHDADYWLDRKQVQEKLRHLSLANDYLYITIVLANGTSYTNYTVSDFAPETFLQKPWVSQLTDRAAHQVYWLGAMENYVEARQEASPYVLTVVQDLRQSNGTPYGYIIVSAEEQKLREVLTSRSTFEELMLTDRAGNVLSHENSDMIGKEAPLSHIFATTAEKEYRFEEQASYLYFKYPLMYSNMQLISSISYADAVGEINQIFTRHILFQSLFYSIFLVVLIILVRRFTRPLIKLGQVAAYVKAGNLQVRSNIRGQDEISKLSQSFDNMLDQINQMITQLKEEQKQKSEYEFKMLQAQINPHFLFNILNSIRLRVRMHGDLQSADVLNALTALLRMTFKYEREMIPLREEIDIVRHYVTLLNFRHRNPITLQLEMAPGCESILVPRLFLQPLIENAFYHGLEQESGLIKVSIRRTEQCMVVQVQDNGKGIDAAELAKLRANLAGEIGNNERDEARLSGIGMKNVYDRMKIIYGSGFHLEIESGATGTIVTLYIPHSASDEQN